MGDTQLEFDDGYNADADFTGSYRDCLAAVRERVAAGGPPWVPKPVLTTGSSTS
jgi:hypothetical protein